jgi:putative component of membrane protein insertase Oxa1/YidC/SpoIIIJ protein YidD
MRGPKSHYMQLSLEDYGSGRNFLLDMYQNYISPVKGGNRCPMYPACSQYAKILFEEEPVYKAYIGTFERILRCGHELHLYPRISIENRTLWYDPPPNKQKYGNAQRSNREELKPPDSSPIHSQIPNFILDSTTSSFADYLFHQKEYYRAATEYMKLAFYSDDSTRRMEYLFRIGMCYYFGQDFDSYISWVEGNRDTFRKHKLLNNKINLLLSKAYYQLKQYQKSISIIKLSDVVDDSLLCGAAQLSMGLSYARLFEWEKASDCFLRIKTESHTGTQVGSLSDSIRLGFNLPVRKPWLAGILSTVVPGAGYVYSGRTQTGITSFIVNGLLVWSVTDAFKHRSYGIASALGFFGIGWYLGNISGSVSSANQYNETIRNDFIEKLLENIDIEASEENLLKN